MAFSRASIFNRSKLSGSISIAVLSLVGVTLAATADKAALAQESGAEDATQEIIVTGSRIQQRGNYTAPNPVQTLTGADMQKLGIINMGDALTQQVSQNISNFQPTMQGDLLSMSSSFFVGATLANLRGLNETTNFGSRTLTLINGRRVVSSSNQSDVVDMNIIPSNLLARMDVVTGGASAAYGSGAMAGVVNLMLDTNLQGVNVDMDYGSTMENDGESGHVAISAGTSLFDGRGHFLIGGEWQQQDPILSCADARDWCAEGMGLLANDAGGAFRFTPEPEAVAQAQPYYQGLPANFRASNLRYSQFSPNGTIPVINTPEVMQAYRFNDAGTDVELYDLGIGGGGIGPGGSVINGDGPLRGTLSSLTSEFDRTTLFSYFEFDFNDKVKGYIEGNYAKVEGVNVQWPTQAWSCVKFDEPGIQGQTGASIPAGPLDPAHPALGDVAFSGFGTGWLWNPANAEFDFATGTWILLQPYNVEDVVAVPGQRGPDENAYMGNLSPEAIAQLQAATLANGTGNMGSYSGNAAQQKLGCGNHAGVYKAWGPQLVQSTENNTETMRTVLGLKGNFGETWVWDSYYQYGKTENYTLQRNAQTNWRYAFATDAVLGANGQPVCRVTRDGLPMGFDAFGNSVYGIDVNGNGSIEVSEQISAEIANLADGCQPLNPFGTNTASAEALAYAFRPLVSEGETTLHVLAANTSGELWQGWGAGPLSAAFGIEMRRDEVNNAASQGEAWERADFPFPWSDAFGGRTTVVEEYAEFNMPLLRDLPFVNSLSVNAAIRHASYKNKGGAGTTGESGTQEVTNWKFSMTWSPVEWLNLRATKSRDLRAATYRELYFNQLGIADANTSTNLWRPRFGSSDDITQNDLTASNTIGNPDIRPEVSDTYTIGFVLSPGGWAEGMNFAADYYQIDVKDGLTSDFGSPIQRCFEESGNVAPEYDDEGVLLNPVESDPGNYTVNPESRYCQLLEFGEPDPNFAQNAFTNIEAINRTFINNNPFQIRGIDLSWDYSFALERFSNLPGMVSLRMNATHSLEASTTTTTAGFGGAEPNERYYDLTGQVGNGVGFNFLPVQPTPEWAGNLVLSYFHDSGFSMTMNGRYVGKGMIDTVYPLSGPGDALYQDNEGNFLAGSIDNNEVPDYWNWGLNLAYDLGGGLVPGQKQMRVWAQIDNLFDKDPLFTGGYIGGTNPMFYDTLGRRYKIGISMQF